MAVLSLADPAGHADEGGGGSRAETELTAAVKHRALMRDIYMSLPMRKEA